MGKLNKEEVFDEIIKIAHENNIAIALVVQAREENNLYFNSHVCSNITSRAIEETISTLAEILIERLERERKEAMN